MALDVIDFAADDRFRTLVRHSFPHSYEWELNYVEHEMRHVRHILDPGICPVEGRLVLEFGCNIGATAVVLAHLGARVIAVDLSVSCLEIAALNAARYGLADSVRFCGIGAGKPLPFQSELFDLIVCNSVLEYIDPALMRAVQHHLRQVLKPGGRILVFGTSNRIWPREMHSGKWFVNYTPRLLDRWLPGRVQRGVWPWRVRWGFGSCDDLFAGSGATLYAASKRKMIASYPKQLALRLFVAFCRSTRLSPGLFTPSITALLAKRGY